MDDPADADWDGQWDDYDSKERLFDLLSQEAADQIEISMEDAVEAVRRIREEREKI